MGWPASGPPLLDWRFAPLVGDVDVNSCGKTATTMTSRISTAEIQNSGRVFIASHASFQLERGFSDSSTASTALSGVSSRGAT